MGRDPQTELDTLDKQLLEWNLKQEAKSYTDEDLSSAYKRHTLIPDELKCCSELKTDYLM